MRDIRTWGPRTISGVAALVLLAACGTTVPLAEQRALQSNGGLNGAGALGTGPSASQGGTAAGGGGGGVASASGGGSVTGGGGGPGGTVASSGRGALVPGGSGSVNQAGDGPGVSATTINVGDQFDPSAAAADAALGAGGLNPGNTQAETNAVVAYINSHGGVAGRKLNVIWYQLNSTDNIQQQEQSECSTWTSDNKVFAMPSGTGIWDQCIANEHAIGPVAGDIALEDTPIMQQFPQNVNITGMTLDRSMKVTIEGLQHQGYFTPAAKLGIATWDQSDFQYGVTHQALPELASIGYKNVPVEYITVPQTEGDLSTSSADVSNAILKFRQAGVDHVLLFDGTAGINSGGTLVLLWMNAANGQAWYPTYGLNSTSGLSTIAPDVPARTLQGSLAVGWEPDLDLSSGDFAAIPLSPDGKLCLQIMSAAGQSPTSQNAEGVAFSICDQYFFLKAALDRVKGPLNQASAMAAINSIGTGYPVISTFQDNFTQAQHDAPQFVRNASFDSGCDCYKYTSTAYNPG